MTEANTILSLEEARTIARRGIDKAEDLGQRGTFVVVDDAGIVITASRMDRTSNLSYAVARGKAYAAAAHGEPTGAIFERQSHVWLGIFMAFQELAREAQFTGPGAQHVLKDGRIVGALAEKGVPPFVKFPGIDPMKLVVDGKPANGEDLCICYALQKAYATQHKSLGDDLKNWVDAYGKAPEGQGTGLAEVPKATKQVELDAAMRICDSAIAEARRRNARVCVVIVDRHADIVQIDRMDGAAPMTPDAAEALAATAVNFGAPSATAAKFPDLRGLERVTPYKYLAAPGGIPFLKNGSVAGAIGISGAAPEQCDEIARVAIGS